MEKRVDQNAETKITNESESLDGWKFWRKRRYVVSLLAFFGFFNVYSLRVNLSIAIVDMTDIKNITLDNGTIIQEQEFAWDSKLQGYILSSFFYGYITTQLIGGYLASKFGGRRIFGLGIAVTALLTILTPWVAKTNVYLLLAVRIVEGIFEGVTYPCMHEVWSKWAPPLERSRLATIAFSGSYVGTVVAMPASAALANAYGWSSIFYCFGTIAFLWCIIWLTLTSDTPQQDSRISKEELTYITESLNHTSFTKQGKVPWLSMLTSVPVWAIIASHFSENWGWYTLLTQLPKFMKYVLKFNLENAGFMSALPYLAMAIMIQFSGQFADFCLVKGILTTTQVRKVFNCSAFIAQTVFMLGATYWNSTVGTTFCLTMAVGLGAFAWAGFSIYDLQRGVGIFLSSKGYILLTTASTTIYLLTQLCRTKPIVCQIETLSFIDINHLDIAPQYASILMGLTNTFATLPGIISPILTGYIVKNEHSSEDWGIVFYIASGIYLLGAIIYGTFASGERQSWATDNEAWHTDAQTQKEIEIGQYETYENKGFQKEMT